MVLAEIDVDNIYVVCGYTDMRKSINGLTAIIVQQYQMRLNDRCLFLFCGRRADRLKALLWEGDGFLLLYKVLINFRYLPDRRLDNRQAKTPGHLDCIKLRKDSQGKDHGSIAWYLTIPLRCFYSL